MSEVESAKKVTKSQSHKVTESRADERTGGQEKIVMRDENTW